MTGRTPRDGGKDDMRPSMQGAFAEVFRTV